VDNVWRDEKFGHLRLMEHQLREILTVKSDDVIGRAKTYEAIVKENLCQNLDYSMY
jgi:DNA-directed RNA polymerase subunit beta